MYNRRHSTGLGRCHNGACPKGFHVAKGQALGFLILEGLDCFLTVAKKTADKNYRMMFTPAPPKSAVPGRRGGAADAAGHAPNGDSRAASAASLRPTVSALATYRTPSPFISEGKDVDVDSLLDFDYPPSKQALGDPDGAESGVLLEMEGSIPVYSEAGDTPEPTRMTPMNSGKR